MKKSRNWALLSSLLMVLALVLAACGAEPTAVPPTSTTAPAPAATDTTAPAPAATDTAAPAAAATNTTGAGGTGTGGEVKVGVAFVTSGDNAIYGNSQRPAVELAFDEINAAGGGPKITAVYEDTAGKPDQAKSVFQKL